jgi:hypothetical protein
VALLERATTGRKGGRVTVARPGLAPPPPMPPQRWTPRALTWRSRCPHGAVAEWTAQPTDDYLRIVTTCDCPCPEETP